MKKIRADQLLVQKGLAESRARAQSFILAGSVYHKTERIDKSSQLLPEDSELSLKTKGHPYVGRGGVKLKAALDYFKIGVKDKIALDVGASTGGFTDCLLKEGAKKVYALDVGHGQIDWSLRSDQRVVVWERENFRHFDITRIKEPVNVITMDVSFISITKLVSKVGEVFQKNPGSGGTFIALIKPQFEVGKGEVGKKGIVKEKSKQDECITRIIASTQEEGLTVLGTIPSPILGQDGNQEYLMVAEWN